MPATRTRKCTRCQDANGVPTGIVRGGECFLCGGAGTYTREVVTAEQKAAGARRSAAIDALRAAGYTYRQMQARVHLEETEPQRHDRLIESVLAGRVPAVLAALDDYAAANDIA